MVKNLGASNPTLYHWVPGLIQRTLSVLYFPFSETTPMKTAYATIKGIEVMRALRKGQASAFYYGDPLGEMRLVSRVFEM